MSKDENPASITEVATDVRWLRCWAERHDQRHEKIDEKLEQHGERIAALWTIFGVGGLAFALWRLLA